MTPYQLFRSLLATVLALSLVLCFCVPAYAEGEPSLSAHSALLMDASDRSILFEKNAHVPLGMASTTKIMTALITAERLDMNSVIAIPPEAVNVEGSSVYLCEGELLTVEQLLCALLLASANDAATALAIAVSGSVERFVDEMNEQAYRMGLTSTHFVNPHGLSHKEHYTTAYDLALLSAAALENDTVARIAAMRTATIPQGVTKEAPNGATTRYLTNHNKMLRTYNGAIGLKTGFTKATGRCLVSAAESPEGLRLIAVTLNAPDDWRDHKAMLDYGFSLYERVTLCPAGGFSYQYPVTGGTEDFVTLVNTQPLTLALPRSRERESYTVSARQRFEFAPIRRGDTMATLTVSVGNKSASSPLAAAYPVSSLTK